MASDGELTTTSLQLYLGYQTYHEN